MTATRRSTVAMMYATLSTMRAHLNDLVFLSGVLSSVFSAV